MSLTLSASVSVPLSPSLSSSLTRSPRLRLFLVPSLSLLPPSLSFHPLSSHPVGVVLRARKKSDHSRTIRPVASAAAVSQAALVSRHVVVAVVGVTHDRVAVERCDGISLDRGKQEAGEYEARQPRAGQIEWANQKLARC